VISFSSWGELQISTIISRLEDAAGIFDPVVLAGMVGELLAALAEPLPGNPSGLRSLSAAFAKAARDTGTVSADLHAMASTKLPGVWQGDAQMSASSVISDTSNLVAEVQPAFSQAAFAIDDYAATLSKLEDQRNELAAQFHRAARSGPEITIFGLHILIDPADWLGWVESVRNLIFGSIDLYHELQYAADILVGQFADVQKVAASASLGTAMTLAETVALTVASVNGSSLLGTAQLATIRKLITAMSPAEQASLDAALHAAASPLAEAYILKALAAGHSLSDVVTFAGQIHGKSASWLTSHLSLASVPGELSYDGVPLVQTTQTECGSASVVAARVLADPMFAYSLTTGADGADLTAQQFTAKFGVVDQQVHDQTNTIWPQAAGTSPWGVASGMNSGPTAGAGYQVQWVDNTSAPNANTGLMHAITAVDAGHPVPILLAPTIGGMLNGTSLHYVLITGHNGNQLSIYDPEGGQIRQIPQSDFLNGTMQTIDSGAPNVNAIIAPGVTPQLQPGLVNGFKPPILG
jgi:uncharacterized protein YukE